MAEWRASFIGDYRVIQKESQSLTLDLYRADQPWGLVIYVHGGGWEAGDKDRPPGYRSLLAAGLSIAAVTYRFSTDASIDEMVEDVNAARAAARILHAKETGTDVPWYFWGVSAGAHLVMLATATTPQKTVPAAVCSWCGPTDLVSLARMDGVKEHCREGISRIMTKLVPDLDLKNGFTGDAEALFTRWSPLAQVGPGLPPHVLVHGDDDGLVPPDHSRRMYKRLREASVTVDYHEIPGAGHALPPGHWDGLERMIAFFRAHAGTRSATDQP